jgi:hypothetical protein
VLPNAPDVPGLVSWRQHALPVEVPRRLRVTVQGTAGCPFDLSSTQAEHSFAFPQMFSPFPGAGDGLRPGAPLKDQWQWPVLWIERHASPREYDGFLLARTRLPGSRAIFLSACPLSPFASFFFPALSSSSTHHLSFQILRANEVPYVSSEAVAAEEFLSGSRIP